MPQAVAHSSPPGNSVRSVNDGKYVMSSQPPLFAGERDCRGGCQSHEAPGVQDYHRRRPERGRVEEGTARVEEYTPNSM